MTGTKLPADQGPEARVEASREDARSWKHYPPLPRPRDKAPNVLLVLTDDVGFGACSTFGGLILTPALDRLAAQGLRYNAFHTTAMCSPTRAALLTGRNHHSVGFGAISNYSIDAPGYTSVLPRSAATVARLLREAGYDTAMFGKNHNTPEWELGPLGPYDRWPLGMGFNYFYGFNAAQTDQFKPALVENLNPIRPPEDPDYHLDRDLCAKLVHWVRVQKALRPDHPFFAYLAPGTLHEPHQAPLAWIDRFRGAFDVGWDALRQQTFARQQALGVIPGHAALTPRPSYIPAWDALPADERRLYARQMEVAAAQLAHLDDQFGRVVAALEADGQRDNTLILFIQGDNGACQEYEFGNTNYDLYGVVTETPAEMLGKLGRLGGPDVHGTYAPGWGWAMNTPLAESKQIASHLGGIRNGLVVSWPDGIGARGEVRSQFAHVVDIAPTILEVAGVAIPEAVDGVAQQPFEGTSLAYTFDAAAAPDRHVEQYFEMLGNRGLYQAGWMASTIPPRPPFGDTAGLDPLAFDWGLYDLNRDWSQSRDVAASEPERLSALQNRFEECAQQYGLHPLGNDQVARMRQNFRPQAATGGGPRAFPPGPTRYRGTSFPQIAPGWTGTATLEITAAGASGPILALGSRFSGATFAMRDGVPVFTLDPTGRPEERRSVAARHPLQQGRHAVTVAFGTSQPSTMTLTVGGETQASTVVAHFPTPMTPETFVGEEMIDRDGGAPRDGGFQLQALVVDVAGG